MSCLEVFFGSIEQMKALDCLYELATIAATAGISLDEILRQSVRLLPPAMQYPDRANARITLRGNVYMTSTFQPGPMHHAADLIVNGEPAGGVEIAYSNNGSELPHSGFLPEEKKLVDTFARQLAIVIERRQMLMHGDRLATIGRLAAGMAHELNEPLTSILGFSQLMEKADDLSGQNRQDIKKIISATLYAREIIRHLGMFARQKTLEKSVLDLNTLIEKGLCMLGAGFRKNGITTVCNFDWDIPPIYANPAQLTQVLFNLVVNARQAMPDGGTLTIETAYHNETMSLLVDDTGIGMTEEIKKRIFEPFFTIRGAHEGTGLGLAIVREIIMSHNGSIEVASQIGRGTRFKVNIPVTAPLESQ
mgnify:CR=1 FL=1